jgi:hypothetical protein
MSNCAINVKKDNQSGLCNTIVKGKLRVKKTARIEETLAVEENLEVFQDINCHGNAHVENDITCDKLTADTAIYSDIGFFNQIQPLTVPNGLTGSDQYVRLGGNNAAAQRNVFFKFRNAAQTASGLVFSQTDDSNYYMTSSTGTTGGDPYLSIRYGTDDISTTGLYWQNATPIFQIDKAGNVTAAGSITPSGTITPFTGAHISLSNESGSIEDGLILSSDPEKTDYKTIINSDIYTKVSSTYKDTNVIGVSYNNLEKLETLSLGEGGLMVCSEVIDDVVQTPIKGGDYLCSYFDGYGTVQDDDLLHNYTVAKSLQNYDFDKDYEEFTKDDKTYRKGLIAVTYHCG